jgi:hypothetical protein
LQPETDELGCIVVEVALIGLSQQFLVDCVQGIECPGAGGKADEFGVDAIEDGDQLGFFLAHQVGGGLSSEYFLHACDEHPLVVDWHLVFQEVLADDVFHEEFEVGSSCGGFFKPEAHPL